MADLVFPWYVVETGSACTISASVQNRDLHLTNKNLNHLPDSSG